MPAVYDCVTPAVLDVILDAAAVGTVIVTEKPSTSAGILDVVNAPKSQSAAVSSTYDCAGTVVSPIRLSEYQIVFFTSEPTTPFEIVSTDIEDGSLIEEAPVPGNNFAFMYRNDAQGPGSSNTGFFAHFRQGRLESGQFSVTQPTPNQTVSIDTENINDSDVWLFKLDGNNNESELWSKLDAVEGNNVIYNSINKKVRNIK